MLVGAHAQKSYLPREAGNTLAERIRWTHDDETHPIALPHPSWRVTGWMKRNPWYELEIIPQLRARIRAALEQNT